MPDSKCYIVDYFDIFKDYWLKLNMCNHGFSQNSVTNCLFYNIVDPFTLLGPLNLFLYKNLFGIPIESKSQTSFHGYILWYVVTNIGYILQPYF